MEVSLLDLQPKVTLQALLCQRDLDLGPKQDEIIDVLGGINGILNHYIASGDLDDDRMRQIIAVIQDERMQTMETDDMEVNEVHDREISLNLNDTILQKRNQRL